MSGAPAPAAPAPSTPRDRAREVRDFVVHLRLHYQLLILPAGYLLGGLFRAELAWGSFLAQFFVVHVLLNGGVTAYNSWWDDDDGPIGGLERPPKLAPWTLPASLAVQLAGLVLTLPRGATAALLYATTMILSVAYSRRGPRWKGHPVLSLVAVGVGTGTNTFLLGWLAGGPAGGGVPLDLAVAALGVACLLLSLYPVSQVYQLDADRAHGDRTFAAAFGLAGVRRFFLGAYALGLPLVSATLERRHAGLGALLFGAGLAGGALSWLQLRRLAGQPTEYRPVMRLKYLASLAFTLFTAVALGLVHGR